MPDDHAHPASGPSDVAALFAQLKEEVRAAGPRGADVTPAHVRLSVRDQAERLWPISAERPIVGKGGPIKAVLRRLMRCTSSPPSPARARSKTPCLSWMTTL